MTSLLAEAGFRTATDEMTRITEAARIFNAGYRGQSPVSEAMLQEAFTTSDFPQFLAAAFDIEVKDTFKAYEPEWKSIADEFTVKDFQPKKIRDLFGDHAMARVLEGEEYKGRTLDELEFEIRAMKYGEIFKLTWELWKSRDFGQLARFPERVARAAGKTEDQAVFETFVTESGPNTNFFETVDNKPLNTDNLEAALNLVGQRENHHGDLVDNSNLVLVVPPALKFTAEKIVGAQEIETTGPDGKTKVRISNPFRSMKVLVSRVAGSIDKSATRASTWYLLPAPGSENPAIARVKMAGQENPDIRVKNDQGNRVGGGAVPFDEGSFLDDTIEYRGRHITGGATLFNYAAYASKGA